MTVDQMMQTLGKEKINTWFDLGLFIDRFKENSDIPSTNFQGSYQDFNKSVAKGGIAFITFMYSIDGVTVESEKYAKVLQQIFKDVKIHYIAGKFYEKGELYLLPDAERFQLDELASFNDWGLYKDFFYKKLERGSKGYNRLIKKFWNEVLVITEKLGQYFEDNDIKLLYIINVNSNPGNISLALALVFVSEMLGIPVVCNNHDFFWEAGHSESDLQRKVANPGPRDHFFENHHIGEVFSILEVIYPWESRSWISVNINEQQSKRLISDYGHNPANVAEIGTAIFTEKFHKISNTDRKKEIFAQLAAIFGNYGKKVPLVSISDFIQKNIKTSADLIPILLGYQNREHIDFEKDNIILLQPTRIISRKKIEVDFTLIKLLFDDEEFVEYFEENSNLKLTLLVTGPIATGHLNYFLKLLNEFNSFLSCANQKYKKRIFLGFFFSEYDKPSYMKKFDNPITYADLFNVSSLVLLPSETEGRGLPILEAAACGVPIFCRRYYPEEVYRKIIGEDLPKQDRLKVIEFTDPQLSQEIIEDVKKKLFSRKSYEKHILHNKEIIEQRFSLKSLTQELEEVLYKLFLQITSNSSSLDMAICALDKYSNHVTKNKKYAQCIMNTENRQYLAGYGQMAFMILLKSLIDPSYFRVEEKRIRGMAMQFAKELVDNNPDPLPLTETLVHNFYNAVDSIFHYRKDEIPIRIDHSLAYRHRNKNNYPYRQLTFQELTGVINVLFKKYFSPPPIIYLGEQKESSDDWYVNLSFLYQQADLAIDNIEELEKKLYMNIPIALFPGNQIELELESLILYPVRKRLGLPNGEKISRQLLEKIKLEPIYIIQHGELLGKSVSADVLKSYIYFSKNEEIKLLFNYGICKIIASQQHSIGLHFYEVGKEVIEVLSTVRAGNGIIVAFGDHTAMMTDIVDIDHFHIGRVSNILAAKILGIPMGSGYVQWVPAGLRYTLAYPTPVQTGQNFCKALKSFRFKKLCESLNEDRVLKILKKDAEEKGTPIATILKNLDHTQKNKSAVTHSYLNGIYSDGLPWAGVIARIDMSISEKDWQFSVMSSRKSPKTVSQFVEEFQKFTKRIAQVAWNGGYILNPELVGKLGIPETFIGSPLGLIISSKKVVSPPLYNKPAFIILADGSLKIEQVNCSKGLTISDSVNTIVFTPETYNPLEPLTNHCFYDLLYPESYLMGNGRILVRLSGNIIKDIIYTKDNQKIPVLPVGLTLSFTHDHFPGYWSIGSEIEISMNEWEDIESAIEAGPQLLKDGDVCINMEYEGWKTQNSIRTQAARLDYEDMRGPKIALGIDKVGNLSILAINGRIRESVGATHHDMAEILKAEGMIYAMGFDPGGSSTLVVDNKVLNISPYNHEYESDIYSLSPEPRAVASAVILA
jgi:glycosyltransferase involved in cell wall biosynthesis